MMTNRILRATALVLALGATAACDDEEPAAPAAERFSATLSGANEVPPVTTTASGTANFTAVGDTAISYTIAVNGLTGVTMGHIHAAAAGSNGGVVVWLLPPNGTAPQAASGTINGTLASGTITAAWIRGISGAPPISLDSLKRLMRTGNVYVNLHTSTNGGGELRGQIQLN
jgi:hypothetical protein